MAVYQSPSPRTVIPRPSVAPVPAANRLLAALPVEERRRLVAVGTLVTLRQLDAVHEPASVIENVYFPETATFSLVGTSAEGAAVETCYIGAEGMVGLPVFLGDRQALGRAIVRHPGTALRVAATDFVRIVAFAPGLQSLMLKYTIARLHHLAVMATCNASHSSMERSARWLLAACDRNDGSFFATHEFLALLLNLRRASITMTMCAFAEAGLVRYRRGAIEIIDRAALERASCSCHETVRTSYARLLPAAVAG